MPMYLERFSCSLNGMEGGFDKIAGSKLINADSVPDLTFFTEKLEKMTPSGCLQSSLDRPADSKIDEKPAAFGVRLITSFKAW